MDSAGIKNKAIPATTTLDENRIRRRHELTCADERLSKQRLRDFPVSSGGSPKTGTSSMRRGLTYKLSGLRQRGALAAMRMIDSQRIAAKVPCWCGSARAKG
jgi:hypothetical protein